MVWRQQLRPRHHVGSLERVLRFTEIFNHENQKTVKRIIRYNFFEKKSYSTFYVATGTVWFGSLKYPEQYIFLIFSYCRVLKHSLLVQFSLFLKRGLYRTINLSIYHSKYSDFSIFSEVVDGYYLNVKFKYFDTISVSKIC